MSYNIRRPQPRPDDAPDGSSTTYSDRPEPDSNEQFLFPSSLSPEPPQPPISLFHHMVSIKMGIDEIRQAQEEHDESWRRILQEELNELRLQLVPEIMTSKVSIKMGIDQIRQIQRQEDNLRQFIEQEFAPLKSLLVPGWQPPVALAPVLQPAKTFQEVSIDSGICEDSPRIIGAGSPEVSTKALAMSQGSKQSSAETQTTLDVDSLALESLAKKKPEKKPEPKQTSFTTEIGNAPPKLFKKAPTGSQAANSWDEFQKEIDEFDPHCIYKNVMDRMRAKKSFWHDAFRFFGYPDALDTEMPHGGCAQLTENGAFVAIQTLLILSNTCLMGYETDLNIKAMLSVPRGTLPKWLDTANTAFNVLFAAELIFRILALRSWFFVAPSEWGWNLLDVILVATALVSEMLRGVNLSFMRTLRILRAVRVARIIRVLRFFRQLRQMLFAILACLSSLAWAFIFLMMIMFMFSILFLQGAAQALSDLEEDTVAEAALRQQTKRWFGSLGDAMKSLLAAVTGGGDWMTISKPLDGSGAIYSAAFVIYLLFVTVGVMNVLTGVFLSSADEFVDVSLVVANEEMKIEQFCSQMLDLFKECDLNHQGFIDWETFNKALRHDSVRAYLASLELEPTHISLIFDLLDEQQTGKIDVNDFVLGMVRLKGEAKAIDARIIQKQVGCIPGLLERKLDNVQVNSAADYDV